MNSAAGISSTLSFFDFLLEIFLQYNMDITYKLQLSFIQYKTTYNTTTTNKIILTLFTKKLNDEQSSTFSHSVSQ